MRLVPLAMLIVACGRGDTTTSDSATAGGGQPSPAVSSSGGAVAAASPDSGKPACPPTGAWAACHVFDRLDRAGLAPRRDSTVVTEAPLTPQGTQLLVGTGTLELYVYPDVRTREREQGRLDRDKYVRFDAPATRSQPTLIYNGNLIAILFSRNDHLRERVSDAITAGPPQPPSPSTP
jgi:hypothetical protein